MHQLVKTNEAVAGQSGQWKPKTIQKNGANPKSRMSRGKLKIFIFLLLATTGVFTFKSCKDNDNKPTVVDIRVAKKVREVEPFTEAETWGRKEVILTDLNRTFESEDDELPEKTIKPKAAGVPCLGYNTYWTCETKEISQSENPEDFSMYNFLVM